MFGETAANNSLDRTAGACFVTSKMRRWLNEIAPPGQLSRSPALRSCRPTIPSSMRQIVYRNLNSPPTRIGRRIPIPYIRVRIAVNTFPLACGTSKNTNDPNLPIFPPMMRKRSQRRHQSRKTNTIHFWTFIVAAVEGRFASYIFRGLADGTRMAILFCM